MRATSKYRIFRRQAVGAPAPGLPWIVRHVDYFRDYDRFIGDYSTHAEAVHAMVTDAVYVAVRSMTDVALAELWAAKR